MTISAVAPHRPSLEAEEKAREAVEGAPWPQSVRSKPIILQPCRKPDLADRYWRTFRRKLGEDFDLAGKTLSAAAVAAMLAPLASKGIIAFPNPTIGAILASGVVIAVLGIHLQAQAKPDE